MSEDPERKFLAESRQNTDHLVRRLNFSKGQLDSRASVSFVLNQQGAMVALLNRSLQERDDAIVDLRARLDQVEASGVKYCGAYQRAMPYRKGSVVSRNGAMWTALRDVAEGELPGDVPSAWQLSAKAPEKRK